MRRGLPLPILATLFASACRSADADLVGVYAGVCAAGEGRLELRADHSYRLHLIATVGGTTWDLTGNWIDIGSEVQPAEEWVPPQFVGVLRFFFLDCKEWRLQWSTTPGLTAADQWCPPMTTSPVHIVNKRGVLFLRAFAEFVLPRQTEPTPTLLDP